MMPGWESKVDRSLEDIRAYSRADVVGCSDSEVESFQQERALTLPDSYVRFLRGVGRRPGDFLVGSDLAFADLEGLQATARAILDDDKGPPLPEGAFVFCAHQGYQFLFFVLGEGPDPKVHYYLEGDRCFRVVSPAFSAWLTQTVQDECRQRADRAVVSRWVQPVPAPAASSLRSRVPPAMRQLPERYDPLLLTFYDKPRVRGVWSIIGDDEGAQLCVDALGAIYSVDATGVIPARFVNASAGMLAACIEAHRELMTILIGASKMPEDQQLAAVDGFRARVEAADPIALASPENWWSLVLEQLSY